MIIPKPIRKFLAIFRGDVAPALILLSTLLGLWFGMLPGWSGTHVLLLVLALVLNVNLGAFILFAALGKALLYAAPPLWYNLGKTLLDALEPLFQLLANLPVIGLTDFSQPSLAATLLVAPILGILAGLLLAKAVTVFRRTWLKLDENSEKFRAFQQKGWVRWLEWLLLGKRTKDVRAALETKPRYVRIPGVILAAVFVVGAAAAGFVVAGAQMRDLVEHQLSVANGAEVNIATFAFTPWNGRVVAGEVEVTDPARPEVNRAVLGELTADAGLLPLLRGKLVIDEAVIKSVRFDVQRARPGVVIQPPAPAPPADATEPGDFELPAEAQVNKVREYWDRAQETRELLEKIAEWLPSREPPAEPAVTEPQSYLEYVWARLPRSPAPRLLVRRAEITDLPLGADQLGPLQIICTNFSDNPAATGVPVEITLRALERPAEIQLTLNYVGERGATLRGEFNDLPLDQLQQRALKPDNPVRLAGGTGRAALSGSATRHVLNLELALQLRNLQARSTGGPLFGMNPATVDQVLETLTELETRLRIVGSVDEPLVAFDVAGLKQEFQEALVAAGKRELANRLDQVLGDAVGDKLPGGVPKADDLIDDPVGAGRGLIDGLLGGGKRDKDKDNE